MESSNYTEPFFGIPCLGKEDQTYLSVFGWESQKRWSKCSGSGSPLPLQNDSHMLSIAMFRDKPYQSFSICFCLAASILCSHLDGGSLSLPYLSAKDANFPHPLLASHTRKSLSHRQLQYRNTSPDAPRSACLLPALLETHLPEALPKAAASEDGAAGGMGHSRAPHRASILQYWYTSFYFEASINCLQLWPGPAPPFYSRHSVAAPASPLLRFLSCPSTAFFRAFKAAHPFPPWRVGCWGLPTLIITEHPVYLILHSCNRNLSGPCSQNCYWKNIYWLWQFRTSTFGEVSSQVSIMCVGSTLNLLTQSNCHRSRGGKSHSLV